MTSRNGRPTHRPRNRKAQIVAAALDCFHQSGYHATGMEDIAAAVGITAGSLYWHFRGKQELLEHAVLAGLDRALDATQNAEGLESVLRSLASFSLENRAFPAVWEREEGNLSPEGLAAVQERNKKVAGIVSSAIRDARPDLEAADTELLGWAVLGVLASPSFHKIDLPRPRFDELLCELGADVCQAQALPAAASSPTSSSAPRLPHSSRREALLSAAVQLFAERGFQAVSMDDIGAAAGISGPAVYNHFAAKTDLLSMALHRSTGALYFDLDQALTHSGSPRIALERTLRTFCTVNLASGGTATLLSALPHLPAADRESLHRAQVEYAAELVGLLRACRPDMDQIEARIAVHSVFTMLRVLSRRPAIKHRTDPVQTVVTLGLQTLGLRPGT
ncbi:TetR family transcriptional regulator [Streptomyces sp. NPDC002215]|uniref:TetR/AcrR family transcriptional regulator n=1 Tax=Streptomyces sp. NPDC002215 TaxID=3154412 RepID=UPI00332B62F4